MNAYVAMRSSGGLEGGGKRERERERD